MQPTAEFPYIGLGEVPCAVPSYDAYVYNWTPDVCFDKNLSKGSTYNLNLTFGYGYPRNYLAIILPVDAYFNYRTSDVYVSVGFYVYDSGGTLLRTLSTGTAYTWYKDSIKWLANTEYRLSGGNNTLNQLMFTLT